MLKYFLTSLGLPSCHCGEEIGWKVVEQLYLTWMRVVSRVRTRVRGDGGTVSGHGGGRQTRGLQPFREIDSTTNGTWLNGRNTSRPPALSVHGVLGDQSRWAPISRCEQTRLWRQIFVMQMESGKTVTGYSPPWVLVPTFFSTFSLFAYAFLVSLSRKFKKHKT